MRDEAVLGGVWGIQLVEIAHADEVGRQTAAEFLQVRDHVAPEIRGRGIAVQNTMGIAPAGLHIGHVVTEHGFPLLGIRHSSMSALSMLRFGCVALRSYAAGPGNNEAWGNAA